MCLYLLELGFSYLILYSNVQDVIAIYLRWCDGGARKLRTVAHYFSEEEISFKEHRAQLHCITTLIVIGGMFDMLMSVCK